MQRLQMLDSSIVEIVDGTTLLNFGLWKFRTVQLSHGLLHADAPLGERGVLREQLHQVHGLLFALLRRRDLVLLDGAHLLEILRKVLR